VGVVPGVTMADHALRSTSERAAQHSPHLLCGGVDKKAFSQMEQLECRLRPFHMGAPACAIKAVAVIV